MDIRRQQSALRVLKYYGLDDLVEEDRVMFLVSLDVLLTYLVVVVVIYITLNFPPITLRTLQYAMGESLVVSAW